MKTFLKVHYTTSFIIFFTFAIDILYGLKNKKPEEPLDSHVKIYFQLHQVK